MSEPAGNRASEEAEDALLDLARINGCTQSGEKNAKTGAAVGPTKTADMATVYAVIAALSQVTMHAP